MSSIFTASSSIEILLQPEFLEDRILARSNPLPLKPVIFDDTMGITRTADALIESSPIPRDNAQALCKEKEGHISNYKIISILHKDMFQPSITFALAIISVIFISTACTKDLVSLLCASSDGSTSLKQINTWGKLVRTTVEYVQIGIEM